MCEQQGQYSILSIRQTWRCMLMHANTIPVSGASGAAPRTRRHRPPSSASALQQRQSQLHNCSGGISDLFSHRLENFSAGICWNYVSWQKGKTNHQRACVEFKNHRIRKAVENEDTWGPEWSRREVEYTDCSILLHKERIQKKEKDRPLVPLFVSPSEIWCLSSEAAGIPVDFQRGNERSPHNAKSLITILKMETLFPMSVNWEIWH